MEIWGHRGASGEAPENTLEAFELAIKQGADGIELDVHLSKDGEIVVIHDEYIERTSNGNGRVCDFDLLELKELNFNNRNSRFKCADIPTLEEVFELIKPTHLTVNIEMKNSLIEYEGLEEKCLSLTAKKGMEDRVIYSSFNHYSLVRLKHANKNAKVGILFTERFVNIPKYAKEMEFEAVHPPTEFLKIPGFITSCNDLGLDINVWNVRNVDVEFCAKNGITSVITNYPELSRKFI